MIDAGLSHFCFYLAYIGGFNYISREIGERAPYKTYYSFYNVSDVEGLDAYTTDLVRLTSREGAWTLTILVASGAAEPPYPTNIHLSIGGGKDDERMSGEDLFVKDARTYKAFYDLLSHNAGEKLQLTIDHQKYHSTASPKNFLRKSGIREDTNHIIMRIEWKQLLWSQKSLLLATLMAETTCTAILHTRLPDTPPELKVKAIGYDGYSI